MLQGKHCHFSIALVTQINTAAEECQHLRTTQCKS